MQWNRIEWSKAKLEGRKSSRHYWSDIVREMMIRTNTLKYVPRGIQRKLRNTRHVKAIAPMQGPTDWP